MYRVLLFGPVALGVIAVSPVLAGSEIPVAAIDERVRLPGAKKIGYLLRQLDLTEEQATHAQGLVDSIFAERSHPSPPDTNEVRRIWTELERAKEAGDQKRVDELTAQLQQISQNAAREAEFFVNMEPLLTEEQKNKLKEARARLERNPSGALRPVDLLRAACEFDLTKQQERQLLAAHLATRKQLGPILRPSRQLMLRMINSFADEIRALLTSDQVAKFEDRVRALRPDLIDQGLRVRATEGAASEAPAAEEAEAVGE